MWHYARALAYVGKGDLASAERERQAFKTAAASIPRDTPFGVLNSAGPVIDVAGAIVDARLAAAMGDGASAIARLKSAVEAEDGLRYDEPPVWYYPVRESLGAALLKNGQAAEAESVFRKDLELNPGNGRSLFGLWRSLVAQNKTADAAEVKRQYDAAWKSADVQLKIDDL